MLVHPFPVKLQRTMNLLLELWPFWLAIPLVLAAFLWNTSRPVTLRQLWRLELPVVLAVACLCMGTLFFFQYEPWLGVAHTHWAGLYAPAVATLFSGLVVVWAAIVRYQRE